MTGLLPKAVRDLVDELRRECQQEPTVDLVGPGRWRLGVDNGRVRMTVDFGPTGRGRRIDWVDSHLWVDGVEQPIANTPREFYDLFNDRRPAPAVPPPLPPAVDDLGTVPVEVRGVYNTLKARMPGALESPDATLEVCNDGDLWIVAFTRPRMAMRISMATGRSGVCRMIRQMPIRMWVDEVDYSAHAGNDIAKAIQMFVHTGERHTTGPKISHAASAAVNTGVTVRKQSVMRI